MPYFNKRFIIISIFFYLLSFLTPVPTILLINIPAVTINQYQPHRLFTTIFINISSFILIRHILVNFWNYFTYTYHHGNRKKQRVHLFFISNNVIRFYSLNHLFSNFVYSKFILWNFSYVIC